MLFGKIAGAAIIVKISLVSQNVGSKMLEQELDSLRNNRIQK